MNTPTPTTHPTADMRAALHAGAGTNPLAKLRKLWTPSLNADHISDIEAGQILATLHACPDLHHVLLELFPTHGHPHTTTRSTALLTHLITRSPARYALTPLLALTYTATLQGQTEHARALRNTATDCIFDRHGLDRLAQLHQCLHPTTTS